MEKQNKFIKNVTPTQWDYLGPVVIHSDAYLTEITWYYL